MKPQFLKRSSRALGKRAIEALPYLVFFAVLFFAEYYLFEPSDALLGIVFLFFSRAILKEPGLSFGNYLRRIMWFVAMVICATLAGLNPVGMIIVTAVYLIVVTIFNSDDYLPRNFFWLGMGYLLLLVNPVSPDQFLDRAFATLLSLVLTTLFIGVMLQFKKRYRGGYFVRKRQRYLREAALVVGRELARVADLPQHPAEDSLEEELHYKESFALAQRYAESEYGNVFRQDGFLSGRQRYTFALLLCFEQIADMAHAAAKDASRIPEDELVYFRELSALFTMFGSEHIYNIEDLCVHLQEFLERHRISQPCYEQSWHGVLESMVRTMQDTRMDRSNKVNFLKSFKYKIKFLRENVSRDHTQTRFAFRLAIITCAAMTVDVLLTQFTGTLYAIWIPVTAFAVLNTYNDETLHTSRDMILGTFLGLLVFAAITHFIPEMFRMPLVVVLGYAVILLEIHPIATVAAASQLALTSLYAFTPLREALALRLFLVLLAVVCVMAVIFILFRMRRISTIQTKIQELARIDGRLAQAIHSGIDKGQVALWRSVQLLYYLHMNAELLESLADNLKRNKDATPTNAHGVALLYLIDEIEEMLQANYRFAMDAEHAVMLLDPRRPDTPKQAESWETPDTTARFDHIDATTQRLDSKMDTLVELVEETQEATNLEERSS